MGFTRRLFLGTAIGAGLLGTGCGGGFPWSGKLLSTRQVTNQLNDLIADTGRDHFRSVVITDISVVAEVLMTDVIVQRYTTRGGQDGWSEDASPEILEPEIDPATSIALTDLHLERLPDYEALMSAEESSLQFNVDEVGKLQIWTSRGQGLLLDGTDHVAELRDTDPADVVLAIKEVVSSYGNQARRVGGFNDFIHVDLNVDGAAMGMRVIRYRNLAPLAAVTDTRFPSEMIFDPLTVDPAMALELQDTIAEQAGLEGKAWDWTISRPPTGGDPTLSYGIGVNGPTERVWLNTQGKIIAVEGGKCAAQNGWCPK